ncbi:unnamed protein product [Meganyctiphanes norvegica]|uniref:Gag protein n=1 Tax=Meganyctiphanes norvegica TaxID=48144 RepID=A0AAV2SNU5_MEGNR
MNGAQIPRLQLPTFSGNIIDYEPFKRKFMRMADHIPGPPELKASYLESSLRGEAIKYMGKKSDYFGKYEEMWEILDDRYANKWVLASDTIKEFFGKAPPRPTQDNVNEWFWDQIDSLKGVLDLGMSLEEVGVNMLIQAMPNEFGTELSNGLKALEPGRRKFAFSLKQIRSVFNDTIGVRSTSGITRPTNSMPKWQTVVTPNESNNKQFFFPMQSGQGYQNVEGNQQIRQQQRGFHNSFPSTYRGFERRDFARGFENDRGFQQRRINPELQDNRPFISPCSICEGDHYSVRCLNYTTAQQKRDRLQAIGKCTAHSGGIDRGRVTFCT